MTKPSLRTLLSTPTWSTKSLQTPTTPLPPLPPTTITHLLRLSALPSSPSPSHLPTLTSHLHFVSSLTAPTTAASLPPLTALRHESPSALSAATITLKDLEPHLATEKPFGFLKRPRRVKEASTEGKGILKPVENWDKLGMAEKTMAGYFVVKGGGESVE